MYKENESSPTQTAAREESSFLTHKVALSTLATASARHADPMLYFTGSGTKFMFKISPTKPMAGGQFPDT